jgi:hypothetical protein
MSLALGGWFFTEDEKLARRRRQLAESQARRRAKLKEGGAVVQIAVELDAELVKGLDEYRRFKNLSRAEVIANLLRGQLLRKR